MTNKVEINWGLLFDLRELAAKERDLAEEQLSEEEFGDYIEHCKDTISEVDKILGITN